MKPFLRLCSVEDVLNHLYAWPVLEEHETLPLDAACDRRLAADFVAPHDLPGFARSTMDGYAVRARDVFGAGETQPALLDLAPACPMGQDVEHVLAEGEAAPILTGGMLPRGADAVVMIEYSREAGPNLVELTKSVAPGTHVLAKDEDARQGEICLARGKKLTPQDIGLLAAFGQLEVDVVRKPRVAILSTGDEVVDAGQPPRPGQIRDVNSHSLAALCRQEQADVFLAGIIRDDPAALAKTVAALAEEHDVVLLSGGSSAGMRDHTVDVFTKAMGAELLVHGVSLSPGKPFILAQKGRLCLMGLPGHVSSALITARLFVRALLQRLQGAAAPVPQTYVQATLARQIASAQGRRDYLRVVLRPLEKPLSGSGQDIVWQAVPVVGASGCITSLTRADGLVVCPENREGLYADEVVQVLLL